MYAIIESGGKQHKVKEGQRLRLERISGDAGETLEFDKVLLFSREGDTTVGAPYIENCKVTAEIMSHARGKKVRIVKFRRRKHHRKTMGHRQWFTEVKITSIAG